MSTEITKLKSMLSSAAYEIQVLRRANAKMLPRLEMFDDILHLISLRGPSTQVTHSEDIVAKINKYFEQEGAEEVTPEFSDGRRG